MRTDMHGNLLPENLVTEKTPAGVSMYMVVTEKGGKRRKRSTGFKEADADTLPKFRKVLARHRELLNELDKGEGPAIGAGLTFADFWRGHYRPDVTVRTKTPLPRTQADAAEYGDDKLIKWWVLPNQLGRLPMKDVTVSYCKTLLVRREGKKFRRAKEGPWLTCQPATILREFGLLGSMWNYALALEAAEPGATGVTMNPWSFVRQMIDKPDETTEAHKVLTVEDEAKLRLQLTPLYDRWLTFMLDMGVRIAGCRMINEERDITWVDGEPVSIRVILKTKGKKKRTLDLPILLQRTKDVIKAQLAAEGKLWHACYSRYPAILAKGCARAKIDYLSPHKLRHTFATRYLQTPGADLYTCSLLLGHKNTAVTQRVYAHLLKDDLKNRSGAWVASQEGANPTTGAPAAPLPVASTPAAALRLVQRLA